MPQGRSGRIGRQWKRLRGYNQIVMKSLLFLLASGLLAQQPPHPPPLFDPFPQSRDVFREIPTTRIEPPTEKDEARIFQEKVFKYVSVMNEWLRKYQGCDYGQPVSPAYCSMARSEFDLKLWNESKKRALDLYVDKKADKLTRKHTQK